MCKRPVPRLRTPGVLAAVLGEPLWRIQYILRTRPHITPAAMAGRLRLYDADAVTQLRFELQRMNASKEGGAE